MRLRIVPEFRCPEMPEDYYDELARSMGEEAASWSRLPSEAREQELRWYHATFWTPDELTVCPPELGGDEAFRGP